MRYAIQYHADQELAKLREHWALFLAVDAASITLQRKSNSGRLKGRIWRSEHGVLTVSVSDTLLRARLQAWIDRIKEEWGLHSIAGHGA